MPNHVTSICTITGSPAAIATFSAKHIVDVVYDGKSVREFSFETIIPKPAILDETTGGSEAALGMAALVGDMVWTDFRRFTQLPSQLLEEAPYRHARNVRAWLAIANPQALIEGRLALRAIAETGYPSWYEWSIEHWGTKWPAYAYQERERCAERFVFKFETAWSFPEPIFRKLAEMYRELTFAIIAFDEGGNFACEGEFNGRDDYRASKELATPAMYERVYGRHPDADDDSEDSVEDSAS